MPRRRTFASCILPCAHSDADGAAQSLLRLSAYAGSRSTGNPDLNTVVEVPVVVFGPLARGRWLV